MSNVSQTPVLPINITEHMRLAESIIRRRRRFAGSLGVDDLRQEAWVALLCEPPFDEDHADEMIRRHIDRAIRKGATVIPGARVLSIDAPVFSEGDRTLHDILASDAALPDAAATECPPAETAGRARALLKIVASVPLTERERFVLTRRFVDGQQPIADIASELGITPQRVRMLEAQGLGRLRWAARRAGYDDLAACESAPKRRRRDEGWVPSQRKQHGQRVLDLQNAAQDRAEAPRG
jgi:hypothetical protein